MSRVLTKAKLEGLRACEAVPGGGRLSRVYRIQSQTHNSIEDQSREKSIHGMDSVLRGAASPCKRAFGNLAQRGERGISMCVDRAEA
jgi:hypothetical protein